MGTGERRDLYSKTFIYKSIQDLDQELELKLANTNKNQYNIDYIKECLEESMPLLSYDIMDITVEDKLESNGIKNVKIKFKYNDDINKIKENRNNIEKKSKNELKEILKNSKTELEKEKLIHEYLIKNIKYIKKERNVIIKNTEVIDKYKDIPDSMTFSVEF
jgi:hypothetical protein